MKKEFLMYFVLTLCVSAAFLYSYYVLNSTNESVVKPIRMPATSYPTGKPSYQPQATLPTCTTLGGKMIALQNGLGQIGCDVKVIGNFDLTRSYCQGQKTYLTQKLLRDGFNRPNQYYATLRGLEIDEVVNVYVYSTNGTRILCNPPLNNK